MAMGQAAGIAAGLAVTYNCTPENIDVDRLQAILREKEAILD
jgi:hypothetical protein